MVINKDDGTGEAAAFAKTVGIPVLAAIPADDDIRKKSANYEIIGLPGGQWSSLFEELAKNVGLAPPVRPSPLTQDGLLGLFKPNPEKLEEISRWQVPKLTYPCWAAPVLANGRLYLRDEEWVACYDLRQLPKKP